MCFRLFVACVVLVGATLPAGMARGENRIWERAIQVSCTAEVGSYSFQELLLGRATDFRLHALVDHHVQRFSVRCCYLSVGRDLDWDEAWSQREEFTYDTGTGQIAFVPATVIDGRDRVHVVHEAFNTFKPGTIHIGYKTNTWDHWGKASRPAIINSTKVPYCMGANPGVGLSTDATGVEWLHVLYHRRPLRGRPISADCRPFWYVHNAKPLSVLPPSEGWVGETWFTGLFAEQKHRLAGEGGIALSPVVDGKGRVHAIGRKKSVAADSIWICHIWGYPPAPGEEWRAKVAVIDSMPLCEGSPGEPVYWVTTQASVGQGEDGDCLDVVWSHNFREEDAIRKEIYFARFEIGADQWSPPLQLTSRRNTSSQGARLHRSADGHLHVMYHEGSPRESSVGLYYLRARGDPRVPGSWTEPAPLTADMRSFANVPVFVAEAETVWVGYTSGDNDEAGVDGGRQAWFRRGYSLGRRTLANTTWEGLVWLDSDYVVPEGHTLTVQPGTRVLVAAASREDEIGFTPGEVDLVIAGEIVAVGTAADSIHFEALVAEGIEAGDWGGIHLAAGADARASRFEFCDLGMAGNDLRVDAPRGDGGCRK